MALAQRTRSSKRAKARFHNGRAIKTETQQFKPETPRPESLKDGDAATHAAATARPREEFDGPHLLLADMRTAFLLLNAARHRVIAGLFGIPKEQENLLTLVAVLMLADSTHRKAVRLMRGPLLSSADEAWVGAASLRELLCGVAGPSSRKTPMTGTLLTIAVVGGALSPAIVKSLHGIQSSSHRLFVGFHGRYGYLVDPGNWRARRAAATETQRRPRRSG